MCVARVAVLDVRVLVCVVHVQVGRRELERRLLEVVAVPHHEVAVAAVLGEAELYRALLAEVLVLPVVVDEGTRADLAWLGVGLGLGLGLGLGSGLGLG